MKRILILLAVLLPTFLPAHAEIWFPDGWTLHRDPICVKNDLSSDSCYEKVLVLTDAELETSSYLPCSHCCAYASPAPEVAVNGSVAWYHNPDGGSYLHQDPFCVSVSKKYQPMTPIETLPAGVLPDNACNICGDKADRMNYLFDNIVWDNTPEARAALLPGVWTAPSENAVSLEQIVPLAKEIAATYSRKTVHSAIPLHYNYDDWGNPRETWRVVVTTSLLRPVCVVNFDALTGEYLSSHLSHEYSDKMLLSNPEKLELEVTEGTKIEIVSNQVNFRNKPKGGDITDSRVITRFNKGDTLPLLAEKRNGSNLWYYVSTDKHGKGYIDATYAQIIHNGHKRSSGSALTDNLLAYCTDLRRWQIENGFLSRDSNGIFAYTRDEHLNTNVYREELVTLMHKHSITATIGGTAPFILTNHYGTEDLWEIFNPVMEIIPFLHMEDWHAADFPTESEQQTLADALAAVNEKYQ